MKEFTTGDQIAISHHPDCTHYFHKECTASWLASGRSNNTCACCRRQYLRSQSWDELRKATAQLTRSKLLWWEHAPESDKPAVTSIFILHFVLNFLVEQYPILGNELRKYPETADVVLNCILHLARKKYPTIKSPTGKDDEGRPGPFKEDEARYVLDFILSGLESLHSLDIMEWY